MLDLSTLLFTPDPTHEMCTAVTGWEDMAADALREILSVEVPLGDTESTRGHAGVLRCLIFSLSQPSHALRVHAIKMLKLVSSPNRMLLFSQQTPSP
jgi:hypothetical protein